MPDTIEFKIETGDQETRDVMIARLAAAGADGFEEDKQYLKVFVDACRPEVEMIEQLIQHNDLKYFKSNIKDQNWNALWESDFIPVTIDNFCCIRAGFHPPNPSVKHDIIITPKMSFGTGHHATTTLMIRAMEKLNFTGKAVFDFGTGTGILAILAEKCGASAVTAIDNDEWAIRNATENFNINNCRNVLIFKQEEFFENNEYDIILANINRNIIMQQLRNIPQHLVKNGVVLLSGLLAGDEKLIVEEATRSGLVLIEKKAMGGWICLLVGTADFSSNF